MWNSLNDLKILGKPLANPTKAQVNELAHYIKVKHLTDLTIVDPLLAKSSDLVEDFVQTLNLKEKERKGKHQFKAECFKVKGTVRKGKMKKTAYFNPLLEEHADRYKRKGVGYIFAAPPLTVSNFLFPCCIDRASEVCAMFAPKTKGGGLPTAPQAIGWILDAVG
ncbi:hypothetical protein CYMTET_18533 [Cymbomonas tetramitiformis]|uniref:Uncharacterized protein n=1 Tax=Cymbomonas tetramitiformis TaxID=36881 RepID=A0AAE0G8C1_9CHLO|nr:hypothetical protein CYMTET_18533 [Cymbomonas tetramitiformis]